MKWKKMGLIFEPKQQFSWLQTHASIPILDNVGGDIYRVYFSSRDSTNRSSIGWLEIDIKNPQKILKINEEPILSPGNLGTFDDNGVMATSLVNVNEKKFLYYVGWNQRKSVPFHWSIGLAISNDKGNSFSRISQGPIMDRNHVDPFLVSSPTVIIDGDLWKMWYISGISWKTENGKTTIPYHLKYAESKNGIDWVRKNIVCLHHKDDENRIGRASIIKDNELYKMWYSYANTNYKIGYAESNNGMDWNRIDGKLGLIPSDSGWDSQMVEYSFVIEHKGTTYMFYNGNDYGKTGFGFAILEK